MPGFLAEVLTWNENYAILIAVETALELRMPPTQFIKLRDDHDGQWSALDKKLAMAFKILDKETCGLCGNPIWVCRSEDRNIDFSVRVGTCYSKKSMSRTEEAKSKQKNGKLKHGEYLYTVPMQVNGDDIPHGARARYFESLQ